MPLLKRKPFSLADPPKDLDPKEFVYQVRFTKEIFRDYGEYLQRINLYRQRVWACKVSGKINLTYEEALVSEKQATDKVQQLPKELVEPALRIIQFSMLSLKDLADSIGAKLQDHIFVGAEVHARKDNSEYLCRILKAIEDGDTIRYKVAQLDRNKKVVETSTMNSEDLTQKKLPYSRSVLKSFIRESTYRSAPWVLHDKLAQKHGIGTEIPSALRGKFLLQNGIVLCNKKRKNGSSCLEINNEHGKGKREKIDASTPHGEDVQADEEPIQYPIDDLLVQPSFDDPVFTDRPVPSRDFNVPMGCVGDLLMVWDFCSSFARLLQLSPYSLEDFESAVCHTKGNVAILVETHASLLRLLMTDNRDYLLAVQKRNKSLKITLVTWADCLCDVLELMKNSEVESHVSTIKRGHYGLLDAHAKLGIFRELVNCVVESDLIREKLDECIEERQVLSATRREEALEEGRKKREEKEQLKAESNGNGVMVVENGNDAKQINGEKLKKKNGELVPAVQNGAMSESSSKKADKKHYPDANEAAENGKSSNRKEGVKKLVQKEGTEKKSKEQRKEFYEKEIEKRFVRSSPLGKDREYNRYWWFRRNGKLYVESPDSRQWGYYTTMEEVDALMGSLNCKGERERALKRQLEKVYPIIRFEMEKKRKKSALEDTEEALRRSTRVRAPPRQNPAFAFLDYVNKWKEIN